MFIYLRSLFKNRNIFHILLKYLFNFRVSFFWSMFVKGIKDKERLILLPDDKARKFPSNFIGNNS